MKHHSQTRIASLVESLVSNVIGFFLTVAAQLFIFPDQQFSQNIFFSSVLLILHIIRSYLVRRGFNAYVLAKAKKAKKLKRQQRAALKRQHKEQKQHENRKAVQRNDAESSIPDYASDGGLQ